MYQQYNSVTFFLQDAYYESNAAVWNCLMPLQRNVAGFLAGREGDHVWIRIEGKIRISYTGGPQQVLEEVDTDDSGNTEKITLDAPPLEYSMEPGENQPYAEYTIKVHATGYRDITVSAINILSGEDATQEVVMEAQDAPGNPIDTIVIDAHTQNSGE